MKIVKLFLVSFVIIGSCAHLRMSQTYILEKPNFYHGKKINSKAKIGVMPFYVRQWRSPYGQQLLTQMNILKDKFNDYLKQTSLIKIQENHLDPDDYPIVYFGVIEDYNYPGDQDDPQFESIDKTEKPIMSIYQESPSKKWKDSLKKICLENKLDFVLTPFLSKGEFKVYQKDWKGTKEIVLGTDYRVPVPWLTALDQPVEVIYIGAALVDCKGEIIKVGAEGLLAKKNKFLLSVVNIQSSFTAQDIKELLTAKREDLPGHPLIWKTAVKNLLNNMLN